MNIIQQILRGALFLVLAFFGMVMAFVFMASTAVAVAVLYVVARLQGRPFGMKAYWAERRRPGVHPGFAGTRQRNAGPKQDVTDIEMREIP
ncbi:hypothetical protein [Castellaniella sp. S9]|uniref:hypothetical protein n=1 Tax=Castellaniella sp. S9 TaxID=2993652 RepID=UPI0022B489F7|nr:hypothetical protein [Castellaniella sp. S9]